MFVDVQSAGHVPALVIWQYLCDHQDKTRLFEWIDVQLSSSIPSAWPYNQPITQRMIDATQAAPEGLKEEIYNKLAE